MLRVSVVAKDFYYALQVPQGTYFAILDNATTRALRSIEDVEHMRFQAVIQGTSQRHNNKKSAILNVSVNLYGSRGHFNLVGSRLKRMKCVLQDPAVVDPGIQYENPHYYKTPGVAINLIQFIKPRCPVKLSKEAVSREVEKILDELDVVNSGAHLPSTQMLLTPLLSIVFSCWTKTLDILERLLNDQQLRFVRVDGEVSYAERSNRFNEFQKSREVTILLMTYGIGAVGLNLTAANRIHIVEPQCLCQGAGYRKSFTIGPDERELQKAKEKLAKLTFDGELEHSLSEKLQVGAYNDEYNIPVD
ncbi:hypothetical protein VTN77DRAFT_4810 [Rasamsonia byssochlamydoides]|uniref:uncharacterized protein n=1 Tax=Rasamsonia byssochlamydoides TaxID=89139 RepID=UPI003743103A